MSKIHGYRDRNKRQLYLWLSGISEHNQVDDECCPDFSCCVPSLFTKDYNERMKTLMFYNLHKAYDDLSENK